MDLGPLVLRQDFAVEPLTRLVVVLKETYAPATVDRTLSTLAGFTQWLAKRGHLPSDPCDDDAIGPGGHRPEDRGKANDDTLAFHAFSGAEVDQLIAAAGSPPPTMLGKYNTLRIPQAPRPSGWLGTAWPTRDVALGRVLADTGVRADECCSLQVRHADETTDNPMLRVVVGAKGARRRDVPLPVRTVQAVHAYLDDRSELAIVEPALRITPSSLLFLHLDGRPITQQSLDYLIRRWADQADVTMPDDAAAHAFRHYFGLQLALRGVPLAVIQQLMGHDNPKTTSIYTRAAGIELAGPLDDAGWLG